ncbi:MAG: glycosyltransferase [Candidatus Sulfotelmatobacter sp.]|jgi:glycosyltransferase involved in cell wall biosynthesis
MMPAENSDRYDAHLGVDAAGSRLLSDTLPKVSIGLPIFNAEKYLELSLDSILSQTYTNFELIVSDNASSDASEKICRDYAARDARVRYHRNSRNHGPTFNFRQVVQLSSGKYFLWAAHDDVFAPTYVARCVEVLQQYPDVVLCYSRTIEIDEQGKPLARTVQVLAADSPHPHQRFRELIRMDHSCESMFGVIRADALKRTSIHGDFPDSDRCMLAEVALYGKFYQLPDLLFFHREHSEQVTRQFPSRQERMAQLNPERHFLVVFPYFRQFREYLLAIHRTPLSWRERILCYFQMVRWLRNNAYRLTRDLRYFLRTLLRPCVVAYRQWRQV